MSTWSPVNNAIEETLEPRIMSNAHALSRCFRRVAPNIANDGSVQKPDFSQDWYLRRLFMTGLAGAFKFGQMSPGSAYVDSTTLTTSKPNFNILGENAADTWQGPNQSTSPTYFQYFTPLSKGIGNMHAELEFIRTDQMNANKAALLSHIVDGAARKVALFMCNAFLAETATLTCQGGRIATFEACVLGSFDPGAGVTFSGTLDNANNVQTYTLVTGAVRRFQEGQEVDLIACVGTNHRWQRLNPAASPVHVNISNGGADTITLINTTGGDITIPANTVGGGTTNYVLIVPHGALSNQTFAAATANQSIGADVNASGTTYISVLPFGVERFLKNSGGLCGTSANFVTTSTPTNSIDLARFPDYKSYVESLGSALDEQILIRRAARCDYAGLTDDNMWDEAWMTPGAFASYFDSLDGFYNWERNGRRVDVSKQGTGSSIGFSALGKEYSIETDPFIGKGKLYGLITRNSNIKMQQPPRIPGTRSGAGLPSGVEFVVPKLNPGANDIWQGAKIVNSSGSNTSAGATSSLLEAPFWFPYQVMFDNMRGMKLTDITETMGPTF